MKALVYHGPGQRSWEDVPDPVDHRSHGRDRPDRLVDNLRDRPAHPQGRRTRGEAGDDSRPRGRRYGHRRRRSGDDARRGRPRPRFVHQLVRPLPVLQGGAATASAQVGAAGCSAI